MFHLGPQLLARVDWLVAHVSCLFPACCINVYVDASFSYDATKVIFLLLTVKLQLQAEERGVVSIKGVCANRYLAMKEDGRLLASVSNAFLFIFFSLTFIAVNLLVLVFIKSSLRFCKYYTI